MRQGDWTPEEALEWLLGEIKAGRIEASSLIIHWFEPKPDGASDELMQLHSKMTHESIVALLAAAQHLALETWRTS